MTDAEYDQKVREMLERKAREAEIHRRALERATEKVWRDIGELIQRNGIPPHIEVEG